MQQREEQADLHMIGPIIDYYQDDNKLRTTKEYHRALSSEDFAGKMANLTFRLSKEVNELITIEKRVQSGDDVYNHMVTIIRSLNDVKMITKFISDNDKDDICRCGEPMLIYQEQSEYRCPKCGETKNIEATIFRDDQYFSYDGHKVNYSGYDSNKHFRFWMDRLQAQEKKEFRQCDLEKIRAYLTTNKIDISKLTCEQMRSILKDRSLKLSCLNENVPLLIKTFGGVTPPIFDFEEMKKIQAMFDTIMKLYTIAHSKSSKSSNKSYFPYFIFQIILILFKDNPEKLRFLQYIHLQSDKTMKKNDRRYKKLCEVRTLDHKLVYHPIDTSLF